MAELRLLLALVLQDDEAIREGCEWSRHFEQLSEDRRRVYRCIEALMDMESLPDFANNMRLLYGNAAYAKAQALLSGELFLGYHSAGLSVCTVAKHIKVY